MEKRGQPTVHVRICSNNAKACSLNRKQAFLFFRKEL